jgi:hypothetical protein
MAAALAVCLVLIGVIACGGGGGIAGDSVAQVGATAITKAELGHWMSTLTGGDFYEVARGHAAPAALVSEPPNYAACVSSLQAAAAGAHRTGQQQPASAAPRTTAAQLLTKCRQLYVALRLQATAYLVEAHWLIGAAAEDGVTVTDGEVLRELQRIKASEFPKPGQFQRYLAANRRSLADELLVVKLHVLSQKLQEKMSSGGKRATIKLSEVGQRLTAKTSCRPGYVVPHCRQFRKWRTIVRDPAVLLEQVATITGLPCINREACG